MFAKKKVLLISKRHGKSKNRRHDTAKMPQQAYLFFSPLSLSLRAFLAPREQQ